MLKSSLSKFKCEICQQMQQVTHKVTKIYLDFGPFKFNDNKHWHDISYIGNFNVSIYKSMFNVDHVGRLVITTKPYSFTTIAKCDVMYCFGICTLSPPLHHNQICNVVS